MARRFACRTATILPIAAPEDTVATGEAVGRIVAVRQGNLLATSFHPEITGDHRIHGLFVDLVRHRDGG